MGDKKKPTEHRCFSYRGIAPPPSSGDELFGPVQSNTSKQKSDTELRARNPLSRVFKKWIIDKLMKKIEHRISEVGYELDQACQDEFRELIRNGVQKDRRLAETNIIHLGDRMIGELKNRVKTNFTKDILHEIQQKLVAHHPYF